MHKVWTETEATRMRTLILTDVETTGLSPETDRVIEVATVMFDVQAACVTASFSSLIYADSNAAIDINRIPAEVLLDAPRGDYAWARVDELIALANGESAFVAHRAEFDRGFYPPELAARLPWICSKFDIEWPCSKPGASLVEVALAHGVPIHENHRAMTDCMLLAKTFASCAREGADLQAMLARAMRPRATYQALVSFDEKDKAKAAGFQWDGATKRWLRRLAEEDAAAIGFPVKEVGP